MSGNIGEWTVSDESEKDKVLKEAVYKLAHPIPLQTQEVLNAKHKLKKEIDELKIHRRFKY